MSAWGDIGVLNVLAIGEAKAEFQHREDPSFTIEQEFEYALRYIAVLESALETLGIKIHENGAVSPTDERTQA